MKHKEYTYSPSLSSLICDLLMIKRLKDVYRHISNETIHFSINKPKVVSRSQSQKLATWFSLKSQCPTKMSKNVFEPEPDSKNSPQGAKKIAPKSPKKVEKRREMWQNLKQKVRAVLPKPNLIVDIGRSQKSFRTGPQSE